MKHYFLLKNIFLNYLDVFIVAALEILAKSNIWADLKQSLPTFPLSTGQPARFFAGLMVVGWERDAGVINCWL